MENKTYPEKKYRSGGVTATVWKNTAKNDQGEEITFYSVMIEKRYMDKKGEWQSTTSFNAQDLPKLLLVTNKAYEFVALQEEEKIL